MNIKILHRFELGRQEWTVFVVPAFVGKFLLWVLRRFRNYSEIITTQ